jgi:ABC-2 type transport system permease protein
MRKTWIIAVREYSAAVRTKAFIIGLLIMPLMMGGSILVQWILKDFRDIDDKRFVVIDRSVDHRFFDAIKDRVKVYNDSGIFEPGTTRQIHPKFVVESVAANNDTDKGIDELRAKLSGDVRAGKLFGFVEIGPDISDKVAPTDEDYGHAFRYQTNRPTHRGFPQLVEDVVTKTIQKDRARQAKLELSVEQLEEILKPVPLMSKGLSTYDPASDRVKDDTEGAKIAPVLVPIVMMLLMFMLVMMSATPLMQGVVEEKMQRIAEVLLGSVRPFQLMLGKLLGMTGVSLTISAAYLGGVYFMAWYFKFGDSVSPGLIAWFILFQALAGLMYGSLFIAIGAACTDMKETQNLMWPVMLLATLPMFVLGTVLQEPNSPVVVALSFFPFATPMLMIARLSIPPGVVWWQPVLGTVLGVLTTLLCVWAAGRIFRVGLLMQGKGARLGDIARWVFRG